MLDCRCKQSSKLDSTKRRAIKNAGSFRFRRSGYPTVADGLDRLHLVSLHTLLTLDGDEGNLLAFLQGLEAGAWMARKCTNRSGPLSGVMKPKPLASLNHLTVPV